MGLVAGSPMKSKAWLEPWAAVGCSKEPSRQQERKGNLIVPSAMPSWFRGRGTPRTSPALLQLETARSCWTAKLQQQMGPCSFLLHCVSPTVPGTPCSSSWGQLHGVSGTVAVGSLPPPPPTSNVCFCPVRNIQGDWAGVRSSCNWKPTCHHCPIPSAAPHDATYRSPQLK